MTGVGSLLFVVISLSFFLSCHAVNYTWVGGAGNWNDPTKWTPTGVPGGDDFAFLINQGGCTGFTSPGYTPTCLITVGSTSVKGVVCEGYNGLTLGSGSLVITTYAYFTDVTFASLTLTTSVGGFVQYAPGTYTALTIYNSQWLMAGTITMAYMDWVLIGSSITNSGAFSVTTDVSFSNNDNFDYSISKFENSGSVTLSSIDSRWETSFTTTGVFTLQSGICSFFGVDAVVAKQLTTSWSGTLNINTGATLNFYTGQHTFASGLNLVAPGTLDFQGSQGGSFYMNVYFNLAVTIPKLQISYRCSVAFQSPTIIQYLAFKGGILTGNSNSIRINNLTSTYDTAAASQFANSKTTVMDASISGRIEVAPGYNLQINGTAYGNSMFWDYSGAGAGGSVTFNPSSTLYLYAFDSSLQQRHLAHITFNLYGKLIALPPLSGISCVGFGSLAQFASGGTIAGMIQTLNCGNNDEYDGYDVDFAGGFVFQQGAQLLGPGSYGFSGSFLTTHPARTHTFNTPLTIEHLHLVADPILILNADMHTSNIIWNGGIVQGSSVSRTLYLDAGNHLLTGQYGYPNTLDTATLINNGNTVASGGTGLTTIDGGVIINNQVMLVTSTSFGVATATIINKNNITSFNSGMWNVKLTNDGTMQTSSTDAASAIEFRMDNSNMTLDSTSVLRLSLYGNAVAFQSSSAPFDQLGLFGASVCKFAGELVLNFVQPVKVPGFPTTVFTPTIGEAYPIISMPQSNVGNIGTCTGQFTKITTNGLDANLAVGIYYDQYANGYSASLVNMVICAKSNTSCATNTRILPASTTTSSQSASTSASTSAASTSAATSPQPSASTSAQSSTSSQSSTSTTAAKSSTTSTSSQSSQATSSQTTQAPTSSTTQTEGNSASAVGVPVVTFAVFSLFALFVL